VVRAASAELELRSRLGNSTFGPASRRATGYVPGGRPAILSTVTQMQVLAFSGNRLRSREPTQRVLTRVSAPVLGPLDLVISKPGWCPARQRPGWRWGPIQRSSRRSVTRPFLRPAPGQALPVPACGHLD